MVLSFHFSVQKNASVRSSQPSRGTERVKLLGLIHFPHHSNSPLFVTSEENKENSEDWIQVDALTMFWGILGMCFRRSLRTSSASFLLSILCERIIERRREIRNRWFLSCPENVQWTIKRVFEKKLMQPRKRVVSGMFELQKYLRYWFNFKLKERVLTLTFSTNFKYKKNDRRKCLLSVNYEIEGFLIVFNIWLRIWKVSLVRAFSMWNTIFYMNKVGLIIEWPKWHVYHNLIDLLIMFAAVTKGV